MLQNYKFYLYDIKNDKFFVSFFFLCNFVSQYAQAGMNMTLTAYSYSQLFSIAETLLFGFALLHVGNAKVRSTHWLRRAKWAVAMVMILMGTITVVQYACNTSDLFPKRDTALNISMLYLSTLIMGIAFVPLAAVTHLTRTRLFMTCMVFAFCIALVWLAIPLQRPWTHFVMVLSLSIYFIELVRIVLVFLYNYRQLDKQERIPGSEADARHVCLNMVVKCIILMSACAVIYIFLVMLTENAKAIFNFAMLLVWAYLFVTLVNLIMNYNPLAEASYQPISPSRAASKSHTRHPELRDKLEALVNDGFYKSKGVTLLATAERLGTNRTYLSQYINSEYGCNFNTWLTRLRIDEAKRLLLSSPTLPLETVAQQAGYATKSHFMSAFKAVEGITPGQWRQRQA